MQMGAIPPRSIANHTQWIERRNIDLQRALLAPGTKDIVSLANTPLTVAGVGDLLSDRRACKRHEPLTIDEMTVDLSQHAVPYCQHTIPV